jgi:hypothetical protein
LEAHELHFNFEHIVPDATIAVRISLADAELCAVGFFIKTRHFYIEAGYYGPLHEFEWTFAFGLGPGFNLVLVPDFGSIDDALRDVDTIHRTFTSGGMLFPLEDVQRALHDKVAALVVKEL